VSARRSNSHIGALAGTTLFACTVLTCTLFAGLATPRPAAAAAPQFGLVSQTFNVDPGGSVDLLLDLPTGLELPLLGFAETTSPAQPHPLAAVVGAQGPVGDRGDPQVPDGLRVDGARARPGHPQGAQIGAPLVHEREELAIPP